MGKPRLAAQLNDLGTKLLIDPLGGVPTVVGYLPANVTLPNTCGDAIDHSGDKAFFDTSIEKWVSVG